MSIREQLINEISQTPDILIREVLDFLLFIKSRANQEIGGKNNSHNSDFPSLLNFLDQINSEIPTAGNLQLPRDLSKNLDQCKLSEFFRQSPLAEVAEELEKAYREASAENDPTWEITIGDGLTDETW
jgi:hypothetical protein